MNLNKSKNDCQRKKILIDKGIKQAWNRRYSNQVHSGVRVKIQRKDNQQIQSKSTLSDTTNHIQSILKRLWIESETSVLNQKPVLNNSFLEKNMISIGIQTAGIRKIDQQTSCNIIRPIVEKNRSSSTSLSETLTSDENSTCMNNSLTETSTVSSTTSNTKKNKNRNNNAIDNDIECNDNQITIKEFITEKSKIQVSNNQQDITHGYPQSSLLSRKKRFFDRFLNLFSFLQLSSFKQDQICIPINPVITDADQNKGNKIVQPPTSQQKNSKYSKSDTSILINKQINNSHSQKRRLCRSNKINRRKYKYRRHRKKQKYIQSSHSQLTISSTGNNQSKLHNEEKLEVKQISFTHSDTEKNPSEKCNDNLTTEVIPSNDYQHYSFHSSIDSIRLRVKNKNLISTLSKSNIPQRSIDHVDDEIQIHQMNLVNEFKSLLEQTKNIHINNNALDDDLSINTSPIPFKKNIEVGKNQNENKYQRTSILSSDSHSILTENKSIDMSQEIQEQNKIIQEGVEQLIRYQKYARQYKLKRLAHGYNFDAITCESCKAFFRRNALKADGISKCRINNGQCKITVSTRKQCKSCRLAKCFDNGMRADWILTDEERSNKRLKIEENRRLRQMLYPDSPQIDKIETMQTIIESCDLDEVEEDDNHDINPSVSLFATPLTSSSSSSLTSNDLIKIQQIEQAYIDSIRLTSLSSEFPLYPQSAPVNTTPNLFNFLTNILATRLITYLKLLPEFSLLNSHDKLILTKFNTFTLTYIRATLNYDPSTDIYHEPNTDECVFLNEDIIQCHSSLHQYKLTINCIKNLLKASLNDRFLLQVLLVIMGLSKGSSICTNFDEMEPIAQDILSIYHAQNVFVDLLWKYCENKFGFSTTVKTWLNLTIYSMDTHLQAYDFRRRAFKNHAISDQLLPLIKSVLLVVEK
ncbi:unnamed protein product [Adineta steineri]|uniref:Nuclear receptor domain-containing protein n=1 Tax=Adineta steineri TaxID=433720 RepID=A0A814WI56_9BILA|nr:unnamed protein product [Adineta steineri]